MAKNRAVTVTDNATGRSFEYPVHEGVHGKPVVDMRSIAADLGYFIHDPGFATTSSCWPSTPISTTSRRSSGSPSEGFFQRTASVGAAVSAPSARP